MIGCILIGCKLWRIEEQWSVLCCVQHSQSCLVLALGAWVWAPGTTGQLIAGAADLACPGWVFFFLFPRPTPRRDDMEVLQ